MLSIHLKDLLFQGFHGLYAEEKLTGNQFLVNLHVHYVPQAGVIKNLGETLNYETLFLLVKKRMQEPAELLETIAMELAEAVLELFKMAEAVFVSIEKIKPPIESMDGSVVVSVQLSRN